MIAAHTPFCGGVCTATKKPREGSKVAQEETHMKAYPTIAGAEYIVDYDYKITSPGAPEQGPSYSSGGQPAEPLVEIKVLDLK